MELVHNNPYRIAGVVANATERELQRQKAKIKAFTKIQRQYQSEYDFKILKTITRNEDKVEWAFANLEQNNDRVRHSLFWFTNANSFDKTAINYLINNDVEKAIQIWEKVTELRAVSASNFSCFNNIATLKLLGSDNIRIKEGIKAKLNLLESDFVANFVYLSADETMVVDAKSLTQQFISLLLSELSKDKKPTQIISLFNDCSDSVRQYVAQKYTEEPLHAVEREIESAKKNRKESLGNAYNIGIKLYQNCREKIKLLELILAKENLQYKVIADNLAKELLQCAIDYFNFHKKHASGDNPAEKAIELAELAKKTAVGSLVKDRVNENLVSLSEMKDREMHKALSVLRFIKEMYEKNKREILAEVEKQRRTLPFGYYINEDKVNAAIKNSLDWNKIIELIKKEIRRSDVEKIKVNPDERQLNEYRNLVDFLFDKLNYYQKMQINYLKYWGVVAKTISSTSNQRTSSNSSSYSGGTGNTSLENNGIPTWLKWVIGIIILFIMSRTCG